MGFVANMVSLVLYFSYKMYFDLSNAANTLTNLMGSTFLLSVIGGFISDTYTNRFHTCLIFGTLEVAVRFMIPNFPFNVSQMSFFFFFLTFAR